MEKYRVGVIGGTGMVGQRFVTLLEGHPWFELKVIAASPRSAGKTYEEAVGERWAMEVQGVGTVQVQGGEDGDCTVKLIITGSDGNPASEDLCEEVYNHIMRPDDPSQRLAGVNDLLTVTAPATVKITVAATVELDGTALLSDIKEELRLRLESYYHGGAIDQGEVRYTQIGSKLLECAGIADYDHATLKINGGTANIPITTGQIPVTESGDITLTEGTVT